MQRPQMPPATSRSSRGNDLQVSQRAFRPLSAAEYADQLDGEDAYDERVDEAEMEVVALQCST